MKKLIAILLLTPALSFAQQTSKVAAQEKEISNAEKFSEQAGTLIQKEFEEIGLVKTCKVQLATFTDLIDKTSTKAIRFELETYSSALGSDTKLALLDSDEIDAVIKSFRILQTQLMQSNPTNYTEAVFRSRSGFQAGCFKDKKGWTVFLKLERFDSKSYVWMNAEELNNLISILERAKAKLV